jgi:hypothetical protein
MFYSLKLAFPVVLLVASVVLAAPQPTPAGTTATHLELANVFEPKTAAPTSAQLTPCFDAVAQKLGINMQLKSDPKLFQDILKSDMHLEEMPRIKKIFEADLKAPVSLGPMLASIRTGVTEKHPAIGTFLCLALGNEKTAASFANPNAQVLTRVIHHTYLLDRIVQELAEDVTFMEEMMTYINDQVSKLVGSEGKWKRAFSIWKNAGIFGVAKDHSIRVGIETTIRTRKAKGMTPDDESLRKRNLAINIMEATLTDTFHGYFDNASVGKSLTWNYPSKVYLDGPKFYLRYGLNLDWARLYETWNLAFITANLDHLNLLYPKLLIPRVLNASGPAYLFDRALALWLTISFSLMAYMEKKPMLEVPNKVELATLWGKLNYKYSQFVDLKSAPVDK